MRKTISPAIASTCEGPDAAAITRPSPSTPSPISTERRRPMRSENAAADMLATSSAAPKPVATNPSPAVDTPWRSSSHAPDTTNTEMLDAAIDADAVNVIHADRGIGAAGGASARLVARSGLTNTTTATNATAATIARATNGPRQPNASMSAAIPVAPSRSESAHAVSNVPSARPRAR